MSTNILYNTAVEATLSVIGGKWKPVILFHLSLGNKRSSELQRLLPTMSQKVLTQQLRRLTHDDIIIRIDHHESPLRVEYTLSEFGMTLKPLLRAMCQWGDDYLRHAHGADARVRFAAAPP